LTKRTKSHPDSYRDDEFLKVKLFRKF